MCSSYFVFGSRPYLAMNFDFNEPYKVGLAYEDTFGILIKYDGFYGRPLGVRRDGTAANVQLAPPVRKNEPRDVPNAVGLHDVLHAAMGGDLKIQDLPRYFEEHTVVHQYEGRTHGMITHKDGQVYIIEPGRGVLTNKDFEGDYAVLTNFALWEHRPIRPEDSKNMRCYRYRRAQKMLQENHMGIERGLEVLNAIKQTENKLPTIFSLVTELGTDDIYFVLYGDFDHVYRYSFSTNMVSTWKGFAAYREQELDLDGIETADLQAW